MTPPHEAVVQPAEAAALATSRGQGLPANQLAAPRTWLHVWGTSAVINTSHRRGNHQDENRNERQQR